MNRVRRVCALAAGVSLLPAIVGAQEARFWPQWRGPLGTGVAPHADPPLEWSEERNVRFKVALPGRGHSTPVVWEDRVFLTAAEPHGEPLESPRRDSAPGAHHGLEVTRPHRFLVLAVDRTDGSIAWRRDLHSELPHEGGHETASYASASPVTDGHRLFAFFGSRGLFALDMQGERLWERDLGEMRTKHAHGEGSSPALHDDTLVVNWDHEGDSFVVALDARDGSERWRSPRDETTSWSTPIVVEHRGTTQVVVPGTRRVRSYDLDTGRLLWECGGLSANVVASPVFGDGMLFVGSSYDARAMLGIRLDGASGDVTGTDRVAWKRTRGTPYVPSPLLYRGALYVLHHYQGVLSRIAAATGEEPTGPFRLRPLRNVYASPVAASGRVYVTDLSGTTVVLSAGAEPELLAVNRLDDRFSASAAAVGRELYLRGERHLYALAGE
jgi:outer membrane protein assembly factor BamB